MSETRDSNETGGGATGDPDERGEALLHALARLKLRLEVCLRKERDSPAYRSALARCLDDVDEILRAAADARSGHHRAAADLADR